MEISERRFEEDIERSLLTAGGYLKGDPARFDRERGMDTETFLSFLRSSQPKAWARYVKLCGGEAEAERAAVARFSAVVHEAALHGEGLLHVLRHGYMDRGVPFRAVFWEPESSLNEESRALYEKNILHCTRQVHYSPANENSIDIVLFLNGIPVVTMELKCQFTGQRAANAVEQYKFDRAGKEMIFRFKERTLVHFAVDLSNVYMTTRLEGAKTYFLPFDQGSSGAGRVGGRGNPVNAAGYDTAYLWEEVLTKSRLLELLRKYICLESKTDKAGKKSERMIFPRYHQLDVVTKLLADVRRRGAGHNYLIEHSAGSGKSNSIAWLAHRLSGLHDARDEKIFKSVIIVTDRRVLDSQLQATVMQFEQVPGLVQKIDRNAKQLLEAIESGAGIIVTTLQKFPVIYKEVRSEGKRFAIIVDEAHSSQTGTAAKKLKAALADTEEALREYAEMEYEAEREAKDAEDALVEELASQGMQPNLSFFAFTATPKAKTLQMFGTPDAEGKYHPFHIYSMRQAIEEGFILDVLQNYMTYKMYFKILKASPDDPEMDEAAGLAALKKFEMLHTHNISVKTSIMLEHFRRVTRTKIGGRAKAMVVTASRLHAVRYALEFRRQIREKGYDDVGVLAAFSGEVEDGGVTYTEPSMNRRADGTHISESALPEEFKKGDFGILIVAEKYQTGFDEPLLHTMFVDKKLADVKAVQTLSRLNRTARGKEDTFVLDFVNTAEEIEKAFEPFYEETVLEKETDPNVVYTLRNTLCGFGVVNSDDVRRFADIFYSKKEQRAGDMGRLTALLSPALERYLALPEEDEDRFKTTLATFLRLYAFITQVCRLFDKDLARFAVYAKFLASWLPKRGAERVEIDGKVLLEYYKLEKAFEGRITLTPSPEGFTPVTGETGRKEKKRSPFSELVARINEANGTDFTEMDKVLEQLRNDYAKQEMWQDYAAKNNLDTFMMFFKKSFGKMAAERYMQNDEFFKLLFRKKEEMERTAETVGRELYDYLASRRLPHAAQSESLAAETPDGYGAGK